MMKKISSILVAGTLALAAANALAAQNLNVTGAGTGPQTSAVSREAATAPGTRSILQWFKLLLTPGCRTEVCRR